MVRKAVAQLVPGPAGGTVGPDVVGGGVRAVGEQGEEGCKEHNGEGPRYRQNAVASPLAALHVGLRALSALGYIRFIGPPVIRTHRE